MGLRSNTLASLNLNCDAQALLSVLREFQKKRASELTWVTGDYCDVWLTHDSASGMTRACSLVVCFLTPAVQSAKPTTAVVITS